MSGRAHALGRGSLGLVLGGGLLLSPLAWASGPLPPDPDLATFQRVCGKCHSAQMSQDTPRTYDAWEDTVQTMIDRGAKGTDDQFNAVLGYLYRNLTTFDVNTADREELMALLGVSDPVARTIVARREDRKLTSLDDLKSIAGVDAALVDAKARLIFF